VPCLCHGPRVSLHPPVPLWPIEITTPGGRHYRAGDRIVTLAPGANGQIVTSERGTITAVNPDDGALVAYMDDGRHQHFTAEQTGKDKMNHGYAITVHRSQGATVDTAHRLEDGGGRELAYVSMSRARHHSIVWVVADDVDQAVEDLKRDWPRENRQRWAIDSGTPSTEPQRVEHDRNADPAVRAALRQARLRAERDALAASIPADPVGELHRNRTEVVAQRQALADLGTGAGEWEGTEVGALARQIKTTERARQEAVWRSNGLSASRGDIRAAKREIKQADARLDEIRPRFEELSAPQRARIDREIGDLEQEQTELGIRASERRLWIAEHPEVTCRLRHLDSELDAINRALGLERDLLRVWLRQSQSVSAFSAPLSVSGSNSNTICSPPSPGAHVKASPRLRTTPGGSSSTR
jgi:predicted  nucleic acid-binding Zn-ribbon protein